MVQWGIEQAFQNDMESWKGLVCLGQYFTCGVMLPKSRIQAHGDLYGKEEVWMPSGHMVHYPSLLHYSVYWVRFFKICFIRFIGCLWQNHVCLANQGIPWYLTENQLSLCDMNECFWLFWSLILFEPHHSLSSKLPSWLLLFHLLVGNHMARWCGYLVAVLSNRFPDRVLCILNKAGNSTGQVPLWHWIWVTPNKILRLKKKLKQSPFTYSIGHAVKRNDNFFSFKVKTLV